MTTTSSSGRIPQAFLNDLLARCDIVEIIGARINLKQKGANWTACCPFHDEKTPSFTVSPTKQFYYCFGCGASGNSIRFLMTFDKMEFIDAVETLAQLVGTEIPYQISKTDYQQNQTVIDLLEQCSKHYQSQLSRSSPAKNYLASRGLNADTIKKFGVGYSPAQWNFLQQQLGKAFDTKKLSETGLIIQKNPKSFYDRFRNRIIFPIRNTKGHIIGFGGRTLGNEQPKYLNSPETAYFHKGNELYGLYECLQTHQKLKYILLVEGYLDVISLHQYGITQVVATLGTATSLKHIQRLLRYTSDIVCCFDGDKAGYTAAWRALQIALPLMRDGIQIRFMFLPSGEDPDSFVRKQGTAAFLEAVNKSLSLPDLFFKRLERLGNRETVDGKSRLAKMAMHHLEKIPQSLFKELMLENLAQFLKIDRIKLNEVVNQKHKTEFQKPARDQQVTSEIPTPIQLATVLLLQEPQLITSLKTDLTILSESIPGIRLLKKLIEIIQKNPSLSTGSLLEYFKEDDQNQLIVKFASLEHWICSSSWQQEFEGAIKQMFALQQEQEIKHLFNKANQEGLNDQEKLQLQQLIKERQLQHMD